jgi:hypothetical protein
MCIPATKIGALKIDLKRQNIDLFLFFEKGSNDYDKMYGDNLK